jgi:hypothetical protein
MPKDSVKKQPYIPLYIGDWEQDCNSLSLQAEAAWLKIIFKMWKNGKTGRFKTSTNALQNLWKTDTKGVQNIIYELNLNEVCDFDPPLENNGKTPDGSELLIFVNRRMAKEAKISGIRSDAVQNRYKDDTNTLHPLDSDTDNTVLSINIPFEEFWKLYDKKTSPKESCEKKWNKLKDEDRMIAMAHIVEYKIAQPDKQFRKDPSSFLHQKAWNNELIYKNGTGTHLKTPHSANGNGKQGTSANRIAAAKKF